MIWKYKVVKDEDLYYIAQIFYLDENNSDQQEMGIEHYKVIGKEYDDSLIMAVNDSPDLSIDSTTLPQAKEGEEDKESVRALVTLLYEMIDDIKQTEVTTMDTITNNLNIEDNIFIN
jgi:hypothetical protein